jgi:hypothetical protein
MTTPAPSGTFQHGEIGMRMTREQAIRYHGVLTQIAQGQKGGVAPDIAPRAYVLMVTMLGCLAPVRETFDRTSTARFAVAVGPKPVMGPNGAQISDPEKAAQYSAEMRELLEATVSVRMPRERLAETDLQPGKNGIPASLLAQIAPLMEFETTVEMDDDNS